MFVIASEDCCVEDDYLSLQLHSKSGKKMAQIKKKIRIINFIAPVPWNRSVYNRHIVV